MDSNIIDKIVEAIDRATEAFVNDEEIIFSSENERKSLKYEKIMRKWTTSQKCIFQGCMKRSIKKSHTIQKSASLELIAENGLVLTPIYNHVKEKLEISLIGLKKASTFPGFCDEHEKIFQTFESQKKMNNSNDFVLQIYRTVCREIVRNKFLLESMEARKEQYLKFRDKKIKELFIQYLGPNFLKKNNQSFQDFNFQFSDERLLHINNKIGTLREYLDTFLYDYYERLSGDILRKKPKKSCLIVLTVDIQLPICLAGRGNFFISTTTKKREINVIFNVLPYDSETYIVISSQSKNKRFLDKLDLDRLKNPIEVLNLIESWMIHGTDHWFLKPSIWNAISTEYREQIIDEMFDLSKNISSACRFSIFNELRRKYLSTIEDFITSDNKDGFNYINLEKEKLTDGKNNYR